MTGTRKRIISAGLAVLVFIAAVLTVFPAVRVSADVTENWIDYAAESFAGGDGTSGSPYEIATPQQLALLAKNVNAGDDCSGKLFKATPHKACAQDAPSDFSSDCIEISQAG